MPRAVPGSSTSRRLALPLVAGVTAWACAGYVFALPGALDSDDGTAHLWARVLVWVVASAGAALALVCAYRLARRLESHLLRPDRVPPAAPTTARLGWLRSPAAVLVVVGASLGAASDSLWFLGGAGGGVPGWVVGLTSLTSATAPVALAAGAYLALRRLEDLLAGHHRARRPRAPTPVASGLTTPHVRTTGAGGAR